MVLGFEEERVFRGGCRNLKNISMAFSYMRRAERRIKDAKRAYEESFYPDTVRYCQEAVELSVKAVLRLIGVEYPKAHDVSNVVKMNENKYPIWFREKVREIVELMRLLSKSRGLSVYGDEERGIPPEELFSKNFAFNILSRSVKCVELCGKFVDEWIKASR